MKCTTCKNIGTDRHHIKTRGAGGTDDSFNILFLCRTCHITAHSIGLTSFVRKYGLEHEMEIKGWEFDEVQKKWKHY